LVVTLNPEGTRIIKKIAVLLRGASNISFGSDSGTGTGSSPGSE
jgi:hypothetical protein